MRQDSRLDRTEQEPAERPVRARRMVSIVFADLVGSTALGERLDPETLHRVLDRYSEVSAEVLERHGGAVEKFVGDALFGAFGLTDLHEDDALRAVRAAVELREAVEQLNTELERAQGVRIEVALGINTGHVFVGAGARRETFATGDAVNVAARLQGAAEGGEVLLGEHTYALVKDAVSAEALEPMAVKGRAAAVRAWRLLRLRPEVPALARPFPTPFVGRTRELDQLREAFAQARRERTSRLCTVVAHPGVGKSRLVAELVGEVGRDATVVVGRCLSYGQGLTYGPLAEIVRQLGGGDPGEQIATVLGRDPQAGLVVNRVLGAIGLREDAAQPEETFWAVRRLFEALARERPLVVVFEDVHWAEPTLLDLLEDLAGFSRGSPILLLCLARPELLEQRPAWAAAPAGGTLLTLEPLAQSDARELVAQLGLEGLDERARGRIVETAEGNPLFLEQLVAVQAEGEPATLPLSIQAVLAARIDRLEPGERAVLQHASVEGRSFHRGAVAELLPRSQRPGVGTHLMALVRKQLLRPERPELADEDAFRFAHVLIREAAYEGLPRELRAELHERMAAWLEARPDAQAEIVGYHLEQAYRHRERLGRIDEQARGLAARAAERLGAAGGRALASWDLPAAIGLLERSASLLPRGGAAHLALLPKLGSALSEAGRLAEADSVLDEAIELAEAAGDQRLASHARIEGEFVRLHAESSKGIEEARQVAGSALEVLEREDDELGQSRAWCLRAWTAWIEGHSAEADEAWHRAAEHAHRAGEERELFEILGWRASVALFGPTPVSEAVWRCREIIDRVGSSPVARAETLQPLAALHAMRGEFEEARALLRESNEILDELGRMQWTTRHHEALVEMLAGHHAAAEHWLRLGYGRLERMGEKTLLATTAATLAQAIYAQGRYGEAEQFCRLSRETAASEDLSTQVIWRGAQAKIFARQGRSAEAEALARKALELVAQTDWLTPHGDTLVDLAEVLGLGNRPAKAEAAARQAIALYERKGNVASAKRTRTQLEQLTGA